MNPRHLLATLFVVLCLALSGLVLRRQIAAHPVRLASPQYFSTVSAPYSPDFLGQPVDPRTWHVTAGAKRQTVLASVQGELEALRTGDSQNIPLYQSRSLRERFSSPGDFLDNMRRHFPEFSHCRSVSFGPVWMDMGEQHADVTVTVRGENGFLARGEYELVRGREMYRIAALIGGGRVAQ